jgi:hypothetical protein
MLEIFIRSTMMIYFMQAQRYIPRRVGDVNKLDSRVALVGKVVAVKGNAFDLRDEWGQVEIFSDTEQREGDSVRVFCTVIDGRLKADAIQSLNGLDFKLYQKVQELYRKVGL